VDREYPAAWDLLWFHNLAGSHLCVEQIRPRFDHGDAEHRTPRLAEEHDTGLAEPRPDEVGDFESVERHPIDRDRGRDRAGPAERPAGAALIPANDGEVAERRGSQR
jgi:hypothetical protein